METFGDFYAGQEAVVDTLRDQLDARTAQIESGNTQLTASSTPLVSVVVPAFNEEKYLGACLDALCAQAHIGFDYEIIVVDDGSRDRTREIALAHRVCVISQPNRGVAAARQAGFEAACGEIIASTDADTLCPPDWLGRIVSSFRNNPELVGVYGPARLTDRSKRADWVVYYGGMLAHLFHCAIGRPAFIGFNFAVRRDAWATAGGFNTDWASAEDVSLSFKVRRLGTVKFDTRLLVRTSGRRMRMGVRGTVRHAGVNYVRVFWLNKPGLPFSNIR